MPIPSLEELRRYAIGRSLFKPTTLPAAIKRLGFVQADPIRAPARAQDLILSHRVRDYLAGDLERRYPRLDIEEDGFVNYGFLPRPSLALMHPRIARQTWDADTQRKADELLAFIRQHGHTHPKAVQEAFNHGSTRGYWGNNLNAGTQLLDGMHYRGMLRVVRRDSGTRVYEAVDHAPVDESPAARQARADQLVEMIIRLYAPLPLASLGYLTSLLRYGAPHLQLESRNAARRAHERHAHALIAGHTWFWPADENPRSHRYQPDAQVRLLAPFDPIVWDRRRFSLLWDWTYKFEAYTPVAKRSRGHYAMPLLWGEKIPGWANLRVVDGKLEHQLGFVEGRPHGKAFDQALEQALQHMRQFLQL